MPGIMEKLFGPPPKTAQEQAQEWKKRLQTEARGLDKHVRKIQQEELKTKLMAKQAAKKGDTGSVRLLAKEMIRARGAVKRLNTTKAQMNSVASQINLQLSQMKVTGALAKSTHIMSAMNNLCRIPEVAQMMQSLSMEMTKSGLIEEMVNDTFENAMDDDVSEGELDDEINAVVKQIMDRQLQGTDVENEALPQIQQQEEEQQEEEEVEQDEDPELKAKLARLTGAAAA